MNKIQEAVIRLLGSLHKVSLPFDYKDVTNQLEHIQIKSFSDFSNVANKTGVKFEDVFKTKDAAVINRKKAGKYLIIYNDSDKLLMKSRRYVFSIAHELGHIYLGHFEQPNIDNLSDSDYRKLEGQADKFAGYLMFPFAVLKSKGVNSKSDVQAFFKCSGQAADVAFSCLKRWLANRDWSSVKHINDKGLDEFDKAILKVYSKSYYNQLVLNNTDILQRLADDREIKTLLLWKKKMGMGW